MNVGNATPADSRIVAPQLENLDPGTPNATSQSRRGEAEGDEAYGERYKGTKQLERLKDKIASIVAAETPQGRQSSAKGRFFLTVSSIT